MPSLEQVPPAGGALVAFAGDLLEVSLRLDRDRPGRAALRTNLGRAALRRQEIIAQVETGRPCPARDWHDIPMAAAEPGLFRVRVPLLEVGAFAAKACFLPAGESRPEWPEGENLRIKVEPATAAAGNAIYNAFVRQFGPALRRDPRSASRRRIEARLEDAGYAVLPPSGTFRELARRLDLILGRMRFRIVQLLPVHPVPTTYGRMGRYGSPFAAQDLMAVDPALAEFDRHSTPLDQFRELADAVHARAARLFLDIPCNHTGWASTMQCHHPEWFRRAADGAFESPGAWGVTWEDLVALDYSDPALRGYMADVFLHWCRQGVDGFRCDAGYMIPLETWRYLAARVRAEYPDTVFLLEGLGGKIEVTESLLTDGNLDWAYSETFQTEDRSAFERYLPAAAALSARAGPLVHFAETHDNPRLAARGEVHARMRTAVAALLSDRGAFGLANGVEWFARERIDVHGAPPLNWGGRPNQVAGIGRLSALLETHPACTSLACVSMVQTADGNTLAVLRRPERSGAPALLVLANLDAERAQPVSWPAGTLPDVPLTDLLAGGVFRVHAQHGRCRLELEAGQVLCLSPDSADGPRLRRAERRRTREPERVARRRVNLLALRARRWLGGPDALEDGVEPDDLGRELARDPEAFCARQPAAGGAARTVSWTWPADARRVVMIPPGFLLRVEAAHPFRIAVRTGSRCVAIESSLALGRERHLALLPLGVSADAAAWAAGAHRSLSAEIQVFEPGGVRRAVAPLLVLAEGAAVRVPTSFDGAAVRNDGLCALLANERGAMAQVRASWGDIRSQYDALLAANSDSRVPADRRVFLARCRGWVVFCGYSYALDAVCTERFEADPGGGGAAWRFDVPVGMGRSIRLTISLSLASGRNRLLLRVAREPSRGEAGLLDDGVPVTVVLRPDIEARSAHEKTKAYAGPEQQWPAAVQAEANGFVFRPRPGETFRLHAAAGRYHPEPAWSYRVAHPLEAERGLDGLSDLFSPGWFGIDLAGGQETALTADGDGENPGGTGDAGRQPAPPAGEAFAPLPDVLRRAIGAFVVRRDEHRTVIAGYPWFLDWGRDTLIVLRGLIAEGRLDLARDILAEFGWHEDRGTLPNMIRGRDASNRDTSDAPLWFAVAAADLARAAGPATALELSCGGRPLREVLLSIARHYRDGTPNGIRMDRESALIYSPAHFTWMDTNFPAATPRAGYPVEIQALWIAALELLAAHVDAAWKDLAVAARASVRRLFPLPEGWLADNLRAEAGAPAARGLPEDALRPNQLLAVTLGAVADRGLGRTVLRACQSLLVPGAIRSLADRPVRAELPVWRDGHLLNDPRHPYQGHYEGDEDTRRKPAYHNGTAWTWMFPVYCEALLTVEGPAAKATVRALLGSSAVLVRSGCVGQIPEILDGDAPHGQRGCGAQAWGVSEWLRVWRKCESA
jgi:glycogen debranching enzyme